MLVLLFGFATALPTDMSSTTHSAAIANNRLTLEAHDGACSPKCKQEFDSLQSCRWVEYCMLSNRYNIKLRAYVSSWTFLSFLNYLLFSWRVRGKGDMD